MTGVNATLAQSAEQTLRKRQVLGSIPKGGSGNAPYLTGLFYHEEGDELATKSRTSMGLV